MLVCVLAWLAMLIVYDDSHLNSIVETLYLLTSKNSI